ncbi:hypothetical protein E2C01_054997 [Portunus trituberculatus]|uniref:Uncharacterized protein n=1 Tax=Portunus trituberculatus TaxID=210409 RepID=A0A5B7GTN2_PORTR|nr:hypothetical protein [Portunus trituberculatus]
MRPSMNHIRGAVCMYPPLASRLQLTCHRCLAHTHGWRALTSKQPARHMTTPVAIDSLTNTGNRSQ